MGCRHREQAHSYKGIRRWAVTAFCSCTFNCRFLSSRSISILLLGRVPLVVPGISKPQSKTPALDERQDGNRHTAGDRAKPRKTRKHGHDHPVSDETIALVVARTPRNVETTRLVRGGKTPSCLNLHRLSHCGYRTLPPVLAKRPRQVILRAQWFLLLTAPQPVDVETTGFAGAVRNKAQQDRPYRDA